MIFKNFVSHADMDLTNVLELHINIIEAPY